MLLSFLLLTCFFASTGDGVTQYLSINSTHGLMLGQISPQNTTKTEH